MNRAIVFALAMACAGCAGPDGNPGHSPYATQPGGMMATTPHDLPPVAYDPYAPNPSDDFTASAQVLGTNGGMPVPGAPQPVPPPR